MAYNIAVGTSDGVNVDLKFGEAQSVYIYEADENGFRFKEIREVADKNETVQNNEVTQSGCADKSGCTPGNGCKGGGHGCGGPDGLEEKIKAVSDCRCVVFKKVGFQAQKQLERKTISVFDIEIAIDDALAKITDYYKKIDNHDSFRRV